MQYHAVCLTKTHADTELTQHYGTFVVITRWHNSWIYLGRTLNFQDHLVG